MVVVEKGITPNGPRETLPARSAAIAHETLDSRDQKLPQSLTGPFFRREN